MSDVVELGITGALVGVMLFLVLILPPWAALALIVALTFGGAGLALYAAAPAVMAMLFRKSER